MDYELKLPGTSAVDDTDTRWTYPNLALLGPLFERLPATAKIRLLQRGERIVVAPGEALVRQSDKACHYFFIHSGVFIVVQEINGQTRELRRLTAGDRFGEHALITGEPQAATVKCLSAGSVIRLAREDFLELLLAPILVTVSPIGAQQLVGKGARWIDARPIPGPAPSFVTDPLHVPPSELEDKVSQLPRAVRYVVFCDDGKHSALLTFLLSEHGFQTACLAGGQPSGRSEFSASVAGRFHARRPIPSLPLPLTLQAEQSGDQDELSRSGGPVRPVGVTGKTQRLRVDDEHVALRSELSQGSRAERLATQRRREALLMQRLREDVRCWREERLAFENSMEQRNRSAYLAELTDSVKRRASAARLAAQQHDQSLLDEIGQLLNQDSRNR